ncbi:MAG: hypothetical protein MAG795_01167 [Candidatus Woesearchaeota archaeon]|nr:hypothetical protein [Candidatus Woesearchaeota archaeon]
MHNKKGEITVFLIIGLIFLVSITLILFNKTQGVVNPDLEGTINLKGNQDSLNFLIRSCLEDTANQGVHDYGLRPGVSDGLIENQIKENLAECTDNLNMFRDLGFDITTGEIEVDVEIKEKALLVDLEYPITMVKGDSTIKFKKQNYQLSRIKWEEIKQYEETLITSPHQEFQMIIQPGTQLTSADQKVGVKVLDREFNNLKNNVVMNMLVFSAMPHGARFSEPVELNMLYNDYEVPSTVDEESLKIAYYDDESGVWLALPTEVDTEENKLVAETDHFTPYAIVIRCTEKDDITENYIHLAVKEDCETAEGWEFGEVPGGREDKLFIEAVDIVKDQGLGDPLESCLGREEVLYEVDNCPSCPAECLCSGTPETCECNSYYYYYDNENFEGERDIQITYAEKGNSCIWEEDEEEDVQIAIFDSNNPSSDPSDINKDIVIFSNCLSGEDDTCLIEGEELKDNILSYKLVAKNDGEDAELKQGSTVQYSGFGIQEKGSYYVCESDDESQEMPIIGGNPRETIMSDCVCNVVPDECVWVAQADAQINDGTTENMQDRINVNTYTGGTLGSNPPCENYKEKYEGLVFTTEKELDTRSRDDFDDRYGDYPQMQYKSWASYNSKTELIIVGSAIVDEICWLLVEAQDQVTLDGTTWKLDFWIREDQAFGTAEDNGCCVKMFSFGDGCFEYHESSECEGSLTSPYPDESCTDLEVCTDKIMGCCDTCEYTIESECSNGFQEGKKCSEVPECENSMLGCCSISLPSQRCIGDISETDCSIENQGLGGFYTDKICENNQCVLP